MNETNPDKQMQDRIVKWIFIVGVLLIVGGCIGPLMVIVYRSSHYFPIAKQIAKEAQDEFPNASFQGGYGSQTNSIRITVINDSELDVDELKRWLRAKKAEKKVGAKITLMFPGKNQDQDVPIDP